MRTPVQSTTGVSGVRSQNLKKVLLPAETGTAKSVLMWLDSGVCTMEVEGRMVRWNSFVLTIADNWAFADVERWRFVELQLFACL